MTDNKRIIYTENETITYFITYKQIKGTYLRYKNDSFFVTTSIKTPIDMVDKFVLKNFEQLRNKIDEREMLSYSGFESQMRYLGKVYMVERLYENKGIYIKNDKLIIDIKEDKNLTRELMLFYANESKNIISNIYEKNIDLIINEKINPKDIQIKNMKGKWGYCISKNRIICINAHASKLEPILINYLFMHELAHIKHPNHSKKFHNFLECICPNHRHYDKMLNNYKF